jgi:hypothetical protein
LQAALPPLFAQTQPVPIVPEPTYQLASGGHSATATYAAISDNSITFTPVGATAPVTIDYGQKAIQELFTLDYGRTNATLGVELPLTSFLTQTTIPYGYVDPATEILRDAQDPTVPPQFWKITHNGVDTHFIHFHLFNVQVINRIGWDGAKRLPDANELGWKDTVRMNPLEDIVVALKPLSQTALPFPIPDSIRPMDVTSPAGIVATPNPFTGVDPTNVAVVGNTNQAINFGWEYVWHCHILGHEENDMMRPIILEVAPPVPSNLAATPASGPFRVALTWKDNSASESGFSIQRANDSAFLTGLTAFTAPPSIPNTAYAGGITYTDTTATGGQKYYYRVQAFDDFTPSSPSLASAWSNTALFAPVPFASVSPTSLTFAGQLVTAPPSAAQPVTLSNTGGVALTISSITITGVNAVDFARTTPVPPATTCPISPSTLAAKSSCTISVTFRPTATGARAATLSVSDSDPTSPQTVSLSGTGVLAPTASLSPTSLNFGTVTVGQTSAAQLVTLTNTGGATLTITSIVLSGGNANQYAMTKTCGGSLAPTASCSVSVTFKPMKRGNLSGNLVFTDNAANSPQSVALSGKGR